MLESNAAYAIASWQRFELGVTDDLLKAVAGSFALVAAADGNIAESEVDRFLELIAGQGDSFSGLDLSGLEHVFRDVCSALMADPEAGTQRALDCIGLVRGNEAEEDLVRSAAEIAMVADGRDLVSERKALELVCKAVGFLPRI